MNQLEESRVSITTRNTVSLTLGIAATVVGVIALLIGWIPFLGLFAIPVAIIGLALGGVGVLIALFSRGKGMGLPIVSVAICLFAIALPIVSTGGVSNALSQAYVQNEKDRKKDAAVTPVEHAEKEPPKQKSLNADSPKENDSQPEPPRKTETNEIVWHDGQKPLRLGDYQIGIEAVSVGTVGVKDMFGEEKVSKEALLSITVAVKNESAGKKLDYQTWRGERMSFDRSTATLTDNHDNAYKRVNFGSTSVVKGGVDNASVYPGDTLKDILIFEKPVDSVEWLRLELPAKNIKGEGVIRLQIPASMIKR